MADGAASAALFLASISAMVELDGMGTFGAGGGAGGAYAAAIGGVDT